MGRLSRRLTPRSALALPLGSAVALGVLVGPGRSVHAQEASPAPDARALYLEHCASCHGETGDGKGTAELDRPARSFLDGGYSYGNTEAAVVRSVRHGIPGTPMPAFTETLDDEALLAVARYVIGLGPEGTVTEPGESVLTPGDVPAIVHGMLPPLADGELVAPRSLVIGFGNGTTFAYDKRSAELRAVLVGDFLDRRDWRDRGGAPLKLLGKVTWRPDEGIQGAMGLSIDGVPLARRIGTAAATGESTARLDFALHSKDGKKHGGGSEYIRFTSADGVPAIVRTLVASGSGAAFAPMEGAPIATLGGADGPKVEVWGAGEGVFALGIEGAPSARILVHAAQWSPALGAAVLGPPAPKKATSNGDDKGETEATATEGDDR